MSFFKNLLTKFTKSSETQPKQDQEQKQKQAQGQKQDPKSHHSPKKQTPKTSQKQSGQPNKHKPKQKNRDGANQNRQHRKSSQPKHSQRPARQAKAPAPAPASSIHNGKPFSELGLHAMLTEKLTELNFKKASKVQETSIPETLSGKNIFCSSETGSGKTFAFLLPMIHKFYNKEINMALIVCPTREIAIQIQKNLVMLVGETISSALVIGGTNMVRQKQELAKYPQVLVATPGRLIDMLSTGMIWLQYTDYVVLDEADRMLDMGFEPDLMQIHEELTGNPQVVLFSATLFPQVKKVAARYAANFKEIVIGNPTRVAATITHVLVQIKPEEKDAALRYLISKNPGKMMVFFNTTRETSQYSRKMSRIRGASVDEIHSKIDQSTRGIAIKDFRENRTNVLMASDVASRGIDIPNVDLVVNFDIPNNSEEYIHRVGRTGRAGQTGLAISFYTFKDKKKLSEIEKLINGKIERIQNYRDAL